MAADFEAPGFCPFRCDLDKSFELQMAAHPDMDFKNPKYRALLTGLETMVAERQPCLGPLPPDEQPVLIREGDQTYGIDCPVLIASHSIGPYPSFVGGYYMNEVRVIEESDDNA